MCQGPEYTHIIGSVHLGNFIAATNAAELSFTHVLNVADNLDMVYPTTPDYQPRHHGNQQGHPSNGRPSGGAPSNQQQSQGVHSNRHESEGVHGNQPQSVDVRGNGVHGNGVPSNQCSPAVVYRKIAMRDGAHNPIDRELMAEAVAWLRAVDHGPTDTKVLVNCRAGIGRAGSVGVAYVFATNPAMSFDEAYRFVFAKRFVYPHAGLAGILYDLYPRHS